jgi:hypothetical protein
MLFIELLGLTKTISVSSLKQNRFDSKYITRTVQNEELYFEKAVLNTLIGPEVNRLKQWKSVEQSPPPPLYGRILEHRATVQNSSKACNAASPHLLCSSSAEFLPRSAMSCSCSAQSLIVMVMQYVRSEARMLVYTYSPLIHIIMGPPPPPTIILLKKIFKKKKNYEK